MPAFGVVSLGASTVNPALSAFVPNGEAGHPADSFITVENRGAMAVAVTPAWNDSSPDSNYGFTVPAISRATLPIDPERGVLLTALPVFRALRGTMVARHVGRRNVLYSLHNAGAPAGPEPLYPPHALVAVDTDFTLATGGLNNYYVGPTGAASGTQIAPAPEDICIVALSLQLTTGQLLAPDVISMTPHLDPTAPNENSPGGWIPFCSADTPGASTTFAMRGAFAFDVGFAGVGAETVGIHAIVWCGVPAA